MATKSDEKQKSLYVLVKLAAAKLRTVHKAHRSFEVFATALLSLKEARRGGDPAYGMNV